MSAALQMEFVPSKPAWAVTWGMLTPRQRTEQRVRWIEQLEPLVRALAKRRGPEGITASEVISEAIVSGIFWGESSFIERYPRIYAWVGPWLATLARAGKLVPMHVPGPGGAPLHVTRRSERDHSHGNRGAVYLHPDLA